VLTDLSIEAENSNKESKLHEQCKQKRTKRTTFFWGGILGLQIPGMGIYDIQLAVFDLTISPWRECSSREVPGTEAASIGDLCTLRLLLNCQVCLSRES